MTESHITQNGLELCWAAEDELQILLRPPPNCRVTGRTWHQAKMRNYYRGQVMEVAYTSVEAETL